jgi:hypothetical protein
MKCENDGEPATYEMVMVTVTGGTTTMPYCTRCAAGLADMLFANNDSSFAGPGEVIEVVSFRLLKAEVYRSMAADPDRREWSNPCHPGEFICLLVTGRDGESYSVGTRVDTDPIVWSDVSVEAIEMTREVLRARGLVEIEMIGDGRDHAEYVRKEV